MKYNLSRKYLIIYNYLAFVTPVVLFIFFVSVCVKIYLD